MLLERLFLYFIEGFLMAGAGLGVIGIRLNYKQMTLIGFVYGLSIHGVRIIYTYYNIPLGTHTFILAIIFTLLLVIIGKRKILNSIVSTLICLLLLYFGENILFIPLLNLLKLELSVLISRPGGYLLLWFLIDLPLITVFIICYILKISFIKLHSFSDVE